MPSQFGGPAVAHPDTETRGIGSSADTSPHEIIAAPGAGIALMITLVNICNSSATTTTVTLKSAATDKWGPVIAPAGGGNNMAFDPPLRMAANEALNFTTAAGVSTVTVSANGYRAKG